MCLFLKYPLLFLWLLQIGCRWGYDPHKTGPSPCLEILLGSPSASSGWYTIEEGDTAIEVYCDMSLRGGGWTRVVEFSAAQDPCPSSWDRNSEHNFCSINVPSCVENTRSAFFSLPFGSYQEATGYLRAYQFKSTDAFDTLYHDIDHPYVDGVSITVGQHRRSHLWTFASALQEEPGNCSCPCVQGVSPPGFVGEDYFCDTANVGEYESIWYVEHPLWEGSGYDGSCHTLPETPWFYRKLSAKTDEPVEVRILLDGCDENIGIMALELYLR